MTPEQHHLEAWRDADEWYEYHVQTPTGREYLKRLADVIGNQEPMLPGDMLATSKLSHLALTELAYRHVKKQEAAQDIP